ncbi:hypothetical protein Moror_788 [Moniliophthora roreri MCA 2997]|uniref:Terpenoid synthase n=1 Tax=Moniliophthora roreri (strain MCA 2997) TaxID=1381753 RepID=V2XBQ4_MONRO|nr:hypothetical protein Moror_788 [Moniliophthora roreri MCA 2997]KAI3612648.1 hypothetical protein WG66_014622 [Moniliophthora roreri]
MSNSSYQLPDLLSLTRPFDLRTNKSCRTIGIESEQWLTDLSSELEYDDTTLKPAEVQLIPKLKIGLLASLCFPTCDAPQLRLASDFWALIIVSNERVKAGANERGGHGWNDVPEDSISNKGFVELLNTHDLFRHLSERITRLQTITTPRWQKQFTTSIRAFKEAQLAAIKYRRNNTVPALDDYVDFCRDLNGLRMIFDLVESAEGLNLDITEMRLDDGDDLRMLRRLAAEFISLSFDIFAYNNDQAVGHKLNIVDVMMVQRDLSIQGAVNQSGSLIKDKFDGFKTLETALWSRHPREDSSSQLSPSPPPPPPTEPTNASLGSTLTTWIRSPLSRSNSRTNLRALFSASEATKWDRNTVNDVSLFLQGLKDCMGGCLNWAYDSQIFFGTKGDAVRNFGWVFLTQKE